MTYRLSIAERIAWTKGIRAVDKEVLQALATFANFQTGRGAYMGMDKLVARAALPRRTVERALQRLEAEDWIIATRRHRHATSYDIDIDRLATNYVGAKVVTSDYESVRQSGGQTVETLSATLGDLSATSDRSVRQIGGPIPSTYPDLIRSAPALVAPGPSDPATPTTTTENPEAKVEAPHAAIESATPDTDLRADRADHSDDATARAAGPRSDQAAPPSARLLVSERSDSPGAERDHPPQQQTLGPLDVSPAPRRTSNFAKLADVMRTALQDAKRKSG